MCVHAHMYIFMYIYIYIYVYMYIHICLHIHMYMYLYISIKARSSRSLVRKADVAKSGNIIRNLRLCSRTSCYESFHLGVPQDIIHSNITPVLAGKTDGRELVKIVLPTSLGTTA